MLRPYREWLFKALCVSPAFTRKFRLGNKQVVPFFERLSLHVTAVQLDYKLTLDIQGWLRGAKSQAERCPLWRPPCQLVALLPLHHFPGHPGWPLSRHHLAVSFMASVSHICKVGWKQQCSIGFLVVMGSHTVPPWVWSPLGSAGRGRPWHPSLCRCVRGSPVFADLSFGG